MQIKALETDKKYTRVKPTRRKPRAPNPPISILRCSHTQKETDGRNETKIVFLEDRELVSSID